MHSDGKKLSDMSASSRRAVSQQTVVPFFKQKDEEWREVSKQIVDEETIVCEV
jgi:hypothetical protein